MTYAICIKCGQGKHGAFVPCLKCGFTPESRSDQARSILLSDHNSNMATLDAASAKLRAGEALAFDEPGIAAMAAEFDEFAKHPPQARRRRLRTPTWLTVLLLIVCLPVLIPAAIVWEAVQKRRLRRVARSFACQHCGQLLGASAVALADAEWTRYVRELMRQHPGVKFRLNRTVHAICPGCGACYRFRESERTFVMVENPIAQAASPAGREGDTKQATLPVAYTRASFGTAIERTYKAGKHVPAPKNQAPNGPTYSRDPTGGKMMPMPTTRDFRHCPVTLIMTPRNPKLWVFLVLAIVWIVSVVLGFDTWYHLGLPGKDPQPELATCGVAGFAVAATIYVIAFRHTWHLSWRALFLAITLGLLTGITAVTWHVQRLEL